MAKTVVAKSMRIILENYKYGRPGIYIFVPVEYTFQDFLQIIKISTGYSENHTWEVFLLNFNFINILKHFKRKNLEEIKLIEYFESYPNTLWEYGPIKINAGWRGNYNYNKSYPTVQMGIGTFPTENEFLKKLKIEDTDQVHEEKGYYKNIDEKLKEYFKKIYTISDEGGSNYNGREGNKLIKNN